MNNIKAESVVDFAFLLSKISGCERRLMHNTIVFFIMKLYNLCMGRGY